MKGNINKSAEEPLTLILYTLEIEYLSMYWIKIQVNITKGSLPTKCLILYKVNF